MCELLICLVSATNQKDHRKDAMLPKRGHVITAKPDGHPWSNREQINPAWQILRLPGVEVTDPRIRELVEPDVKVVEIAERFDKPPSYRMQMLAYRAARLLLDDAGKDIAADLEALLAIKATRQGAAADKSQLLASAEIDRSRREAKVTERVVERLSEPK